MMRPGSGSRAWARSLVPTGVVIAVMVGVAGCASGGGTAASPGSAGIREAASGGLSLADAQARRPLECVAGVTARHPVAGASVGVRVRTVRGARVRVVALYRVPRRRAGRAGVNGHRTFWFSTSDAVAGYRVKVDVRVSWRGRKGSCSTWFTPRQGGTAPQPTPTPTATPSPTGTSVAAAWCSATASVYNASKDWNNVYVNSNQPYRSATASADGYSWSYETNSSGYAEIYLNGPPPGAEITVTVGGATCSARD